MAAVTICSDFGAQKNKVWPIWHCKSSAKGKVHSNRGLPQEIRKKNQINNLILHLKQLEREEVKKPQGL